MAVAYVQSAPTAPGTGSGSTSSATFTQAFGAVNSAGNCLVAVMTWDSTSVHAVDHVDDTAGNTWTLAKANEDTIGDNGLAIYVCWNCVGGANTVTAHWVSPVPYRSMIIGEYFGVGTVSPIDGTAGQSPSDAATSTTDDATTGTATTTTDGDLIVGAIEQYHASTVDAGTGFTQRTYYVSGGIRELSMQDMVQTTAGAVASTNTVSSSTRYNAVMVALRAAANIESASGSLGTRLVITGSVSPVHVVTGTLGVGLALTGVVDADETHVVNGAFGVGVELHDEAVKVGVEPPANFGVALPLTGAASKSVAVTGLLTLTLNTTARNESATNRDLTITVGPPLGNWAATSAGGDWSSTSVGGGGWTTGIAGGDWQAISPTA